MPVISSSWNKTFPFEGFKFPAIKLNKVVLPDPLGPITPVIEPFLIFNEQFETAAKPPKYLVSKSQTPGGLNEQGVKELKRSGFYKSLEKSLNSILKRLNKK